MLFSFSHYLYSLEYIPFRHLRGILGGVAQKSLSAPNAVWSGFLRWEADSKWAFLWANWLGITMLSTYLCLLIGKTEILIFSDFTYYNIYNLPHYAF